MKKVDDRGGWPDDTLIGRSEHDPAYGEQQADAMMRLLTSPDRQPCDLPGAATQPAVYGAFGLLTQAAAMITPPGQNPTKTIQSARSRSGGAD